MQSPENISMFLIKLSSVELLFKRIPKFTNRNGKCNRNIDRAVNVQSLYLTNVQLKKNLIPACLDPHFLKIQINEINRRQNSLIQLFQLIIIREIQA